MKKLLLLLICFFSFISAYSQTTKAPLAQNIEAIASLVWSLIALLIFILLIPQIKKMLSKGNLSIKVGNMELNIQQAATQLTKNVLDLESQVMDLKCELDEATNKKVTISPAAKKEDWRILWVTEN